MSGTRIPQGIVQRRVLAASEAVLGAAGMSPHVSSSVMCSLTGLVLLYGTALLLIDSEACLRISHVSSCQVAVLQIFYLRLWLFFSLCDFFSWTKFPNFNVVDFVEIFLYGLFLSEKPFCLLLLFLVCFSFLSLITSDLFPSMVWGWDPPSVFSV